MRAGARFDADDAGRQRCDQRIELNSRHLGLAQIGSSCLVHTVHCKYVSGEIDPDRNSGRDFPFRVS